MRTARTLLYALAACAALLAGLGAAIGPAPPEMRTGGLTAATVLGTDGIAPARPGPAG